MSEEAGTTMVFGRVMTVVEVEGVMMPVVTVSTGSVVKTVDVAAMTPKSPSVSTSPSSYLSENGVTHTPPQHSYTQEYNSPHSHFPDNSNTPQPYHTPQP